MFTVNLKKFFDDYRGRFGAPTQVEVDGLEYLLLALADDRKVTMIRHAAYMLATVRGEAVAYQPVRERRASPLRQPRLYYLQSKYWSSGFYGRGFVQLTWRENYAKAGAWLAGERFTLTTDRREIVVEASTFTDSPDLVLDRAVAYRIMREGMLRGGFRAGHSLAAYIREGKPPDYFNARNIINAGHDKAAQFAYDASRFELCLRAASEVTR